jgi:hypothetical protein
VAGDELALQAIAEQLCDENPPCGAAHFQPSTVALAPDVQVHLGDSALPPPWWPLYGGIVPSLVWQSGFYLTSTPADPQELVLEIMQPNELGNQILLNGDRLHTLPLPTSDFTSRWLTLRLPISSSLLRPSWNELTIQAGHLPPDFHLDYFVWDDIMLRNVRLQPALPVHP